MIAAATQNDYGKLFVWSLILIAVVVVGFFVVVWVKRRMQAQDPPTAPLGFTLADLRELHRSGKMTDEEFERARGKMVASLKRQDEKPKKPS